MRKKCVAFSKAQTEEKQKKNKQKQTGNDELANEREEHRANKANAMNTTTTVAAMMTMTTRRTNDGFQSLYEFLPGSFKMFIIVQEHIFRYYPGQASAKCKNANTIEWNRFDGMMFSNASPTTFLNVNVVYGNNFVKYFDIWEAFGLSGGLCKVWDGRGQMRIKMHPRNETNVLNETCPCSLKSIPVGGDDGERELSCLWYYNRKFNSSRVDDGTEAAGKVEGPTSAQGSVDAMLLTVLPCSLRFGSLVKFILISMNVLCILWRIFHEWRRWGDDVKYAHVSHTVMMHGKRLTNGKLSVHCKIHKLRRMSFG